MNPIELLKLVAANEPVYDDWSCLWCRGQRPSYRVLETKEEDIPPIPHKMDCPYRLVVEYLNTQV